MPPADRAISAARNALEFARFGGLRMDDEHAPFDVVANHRLFRVRRYFADDPEGPPVLCVPPSLIDANLYDVSPDSSAVRILREQGIDPWVVDFGAPEREEDGMMRTLSDHTSAVARAIDVVHRTTGQDVHVCGYSQAGLFAYQAVALRRSAAVASVITLGTPMRWGHIVPSWLPEEQGLRLAAAAFGALGRRGAVPGWVAKHGFRMMDPLKAVRTQIDFVRRLHDREQLLRRESQRRFLEGEGWVAWPGPAVIEFAQQVLTHNRLADGGLVVDGTAVSLADISCPVLAITGERDGIAPADASLAIGDAAPAAELWGHVVDTGHYGLVVGSKASRHTWPTAAAFVRWRAGDGERPEGLTRPVEGTPENLPAPRLPHVGLELAAGATIGIASTVRRAATDGAEQARSLVREALEQLPRLAELQRVRPGTRTSFGLLLDRGAAEDPEQVLFLFEERAHTREAAKRRTDAVVRGLISVGVRRGDHVAVLMNARPSALIAVAALNRIGAVAVLLRPEGVPAEEAGLGDATRVVCDPELVDAARSTGLPTHVLGARREAGVPPGVDDLEQVDPDRVELPSWYVPNPGRARDLAFILFTGQPGATRTNRVTNHRWLVSGVGTATASSLDVHDTVYSATPLSHPSGLLVALGGAVCGGARFALARRWDAPTFYSEARRYGATVVVYTWSMLDDVIEHPPGPGPSRIRLFVGSGMPASLQRRTIERFPKARVVEFWTSVDTEAVLVNLGSQKPGSMGRSLPGTARVRLVEADDENDVLLGPDGQARSCVPGREGVLIAQVSQHDADRGTVRARRGMFAAGDAWVVTGDRFVRDDDGDFWRIDGPSRMIPSPGGPRSPLAIRDAVEHLGPVLTAVVHEIADGDDRLACAAVQLRAGRELSAAELDALLLEDEHARPDVVHVSDGIRRTALHRPLLEEAPREVPLSSAEAPAWRLDASGTRYVASVRS